MHQNRINILFLLIIAASPNCHAGNFFASLEKYDYRTNLAGIDLDYEPLGATIGASFNVNNSSFLQIQYGSWSEGNADVSDPDMESSDFDSNLVNIGYGYGRGNWDVYASYTDLKDEMTVTHGQNLEFRSIGETNSRSLQANVGFDLEAGNLNHNLRLGLQYDDSLTTGMLDQENRAVRQENDAFYATLMLGTDYFMINQDSTAWFVGFNASWYQTLSSNESFSSISADNLENVIGQTGIPLAGRGAPRTNIGQIGNGAIGVNRTFGDSFGVLSVYLTYVMSEHWDIDLNPSFGFGGDVNNDSITLTINRRF